MLRPKSFGWIHWLPGLDLAAWVVFLNLTCRKDERLEFPFSRVICLLLNLALGFLVDLILGRRLRPLRLFGSPATTRLSPEAFLGRKNGSHQEVEVLQIKWKAQSD